MNLFRSFVCVGAGNVATHLCRGLCKKGYVLKLVYSRSRKSAYELASPFGSVSTDLISDIPEDADFYLISVSDNALQSVINEMRVTDKLIFHTAGSFGLEVFGDRFMKSGILYPLQTFSKNHQLDLSVVPFLVEGCDEETSDDLYFLANQLSGLVLKLDEQKRKWIHLAAVFASNFTNHMYVIADDILEKENLGISLLYPLMEETLRKAQKNKPHKGQTGPAIRRDTNTIENHLKLLADYPDLQKMYTFISSNIMAYYSKKKYKK